MLSRALGMAREHRRSEQVGAVGWEAVRKVRNTQHATVRNCTQQQPTATAERLATGHDSRGFEKQIKLACSQCRREASSSSWSDISSHGSNSVCEGKRRRRSRLIRLEKNHMDCCFAVNQYDNANIAETVPNVSSPEMFDSDTESDTANKNVEAVADNGTDAAAVVAVPPRIPTQAELIAKSDSYMLVKINKYLSGVPPPPRHTMCQSDCSEFLQHIYENRQLFYNGDPLSMASLLESTGSTKPEEQRAAETNATTVSLHSTKGTPRNLTTAFDACDSATSTADGTNVGRSASAKSNVQYSVSKEIKNSVSTKETVTVVDTAVVSYEHAPLLYHTIGEKEAKALAWPQASSHKFHGIHYNRSRTVEEFENLTVKLCERYIGAETQSTCNIWFSKQPPGSARKRSLLTKRGNGQSPEKRLTHLARRRRTFCSANLQGLGLADKRQLMIPIKKLTHKKGKSPRGKSLRGKSPRGKSPRGKSPRSSAKKKVVRRLMLDESSPCKSKLETSKRALFQSPPSDHPGPSKLLSTNNTDTQKIKRVLFSTPKKNESEDAKQPSTREESRKRKCEEELQGPRLKWAKSLSFDCTHELKNTSKVTWDRHSSSSILKKNETSFSQGKNELSNTHKKKLLWAVAEALRSKGIGMSHPKFKQYAANLARTIKKFMPDLENRNIPRKPGSTSDRMLKLAKHHVLFLVDSRPID